LRSAKAFAPISSSHVWDSGVAKSSVQSNPMLLVQLEQNAFGNGILLFVRKSLKFLKGFLEQLRHGKTE
jgi:hypothetical protein